MQILVMSLLVIHTTQNKIKKKYKLYLVVDKVDYSVDAAGLVLGWEAPVRVV